MKKNILFLTIVYIPLAVYQLLKWLRCDNFNDLFHFSIPGYLLRIEEYTHNDKGADVLITRMLHNKVSVFFPDVLHAYLKFWDLHYLLTFLTCLGFAGILFGFWYVYQQKKKKLLLLLVAIIVFSPLLEVYFYQKVPYIIRVLTLWLPLQLFALFGLLTFLSKQKKKGLLIVGGLVVLSLLWLISFPNLLQQYCINFH